MEIQQVVDQQTHPALTLIAARPDIFARQGSVVATWRRRGTHTYGPYYRLGYRDGRRRHTVYLGRDGSLVDQIRRRLHVLQQPLHQHRTLDRLRRQISAALRIQKTRLDARLRPFGLRLQGFEVRGWRTSPLRRPLIQMQPSRFRVARRRQLRFYPKGPAAAALRKRKNAIPRSPQARLEAVLAARRRATSHGLPNAPPPPNTLGK